MRTRSCEPAVDGRLQMSVRCEEWPLAREFRISRGTILVARPLVVELREGRFAGRGECEAHESDMTVVEDSLRRLEQLRCVVERPGFSREALQELLPACPIRNALDCAMWDLEARRTGTPVWRLAGLEEPRHVATVYTISVDDPEAMARQAASVCTLPFLKIKLKGRGDVERVRAVRRAAPRSRLIVDANEAWSFAELQAFAPQLRALGVELIEQPLPRGRDAMLATYRSPIPLCADETCTDSGTLPDVAGKYQFINIKLDKAGGLTEAISLCRRASAQGLGIMVGCMVGTSLAMAPALLLARYARFVDLDGPLLLRKDRQPGLEFAAGIVKPPTAAIWG